MFGSFVFAFASAASDGCFALREKTSRRGRLFRGGKVFFLTKGLKECRKQKKGKKEVGEPRT
jgi:hypothetical protein